MSCERDAVICFREAVCDNAFIASAELLRKAYGTVAEEFALTKENAATNTAFIEADNIKALYDKGVKLYRVFINNILVGFVAIEKATDELYYMEKLAVLPEFRHLGIGRRIMDFVFECVRKNGGKKVSIGIINDSKVLKDWYLKYGFVEKEIKSYKHLPFTVCIMEKGI